MLVRVNKSSPQNFFFTSLQFSEHITVILNHISPYCEGVVLDINRYGDYEEYVLCQITCKVSDNIDTHMEVRVHIGKKYAFMQMLKHV